MSALNRQNSIIEMLKATDSPVSGSTLSEKFNVSRQIIVKDINALKERGFLIISTAKGYVLDHSDDVIRIFKVHHTIDDTEKELNLFVDMGAEVRDVFIYHKVYGEIHAKLNIRSRKDVKDFCSDIANGRSSLLMNTTSGFHYHTVVARDEETMTLIERSLKENGFLAELTDYEPEGVYRISK
ncbi:MAG: transcription repressor NadR [Lachnospiraceae bacterium]|nr:transcription repressor NadR [Lachnospiraceae bacterium]